MPFSLFVQRIKFLCPPSSALSFNTACPVVPEPAKKSSIVAFLFGLNLIRNSISVVGFGLLNLFVILNIFFKRTTDFFFNLFDHKT